MITDFDRFKTPFNLGTVFFVVVFFGYLSVAPQLVSLHAVAVVERDGAAVGDGVEANLLGVHGVAGADVLAPAEREHLPGDMTAARDEQRAT